MDLTLDAISREKVCERVVQFTSPRKSVCVVVEETSDRLRIITEMKRYVSELSKRIAVPLDKFPYGIALWNQFFKVCGADLLKEKVHPKFFETFACHSKKT